MAACAAHMAAHMQGFQVGSVFRNSSSGISAGARRGPFVIDAKATPAATPGSCETHGVLKLEGVLVFARLARYCWSKSSSLGLCVGQCGSREFYL